MPTRVPRVRYRIRWQRLLVVSLLAFAILIGLGAAALYLYSNYVYTYKVNLSDNVPYQEELVTTAETLSPERVNILLLGLDDPDRTLPGATARRSDTMIVASIGLKDADVKLLSIPRDTRVTIPGRQQPEKISHAHAHGGTELAMKTVENLLGIPINYYLSADWQGFIKIIDIIGGVELYVEQNMNYEDPYADLSIHINKGYQHLTGQKAGEYVRFRSDELGDIGRVQRQQRFLKAMASELLQVDSILKLPSVVSTINQYVTTDMTLFTLVKLANTLKSVDPNRITMEMLPGTFADIDGLSYWAPNKTKLQQVVQRLFLANDQATPNGAGRGAKTQLNKDEEGLNG